MAAEFEARPRRGRGALVPVVFAWAVGGLPVIAGAECELLETTGAVTVESCPIEGADYPLLRARAVVRSSISAVVALLEDADACPDWQAMCEEERATALEGPFRSLRQRVSGRGIARRVTANRVAWWRTVDGGVIGDIAGADDLAPDFEGKRVLCLRSRWFLAPASAEGAIEVVQESVSDPQPPFGLGAGVVTPRTAKTMVETLTKMSARLATGPPGAGPTIESLPLLEGELPDIGEEFARCQAARRE